MLVARLTGRAWQKARATTSSSSAHDGMFKAKMARPAPQNRAADQSAPERSGHARVQYSTARSLLSLRIKQIVSHLIVVSFCLDYAGFLGVFRWVQKTVAKEDGREKMYAASFLSFSGGKRTGNTTIFSAGRRPAPPSTHGLVGGGGLERRQSSNFLFFLFFGVFYWAVWWAESRESQFCSRGP